MGNSNYGNLYYDNGTIKYEGDLKENIPYGKGVKYYKNGEIHMEGLFGDWFIEEGKEYFENENIKFEGNYNTGVRTYYGPRYFRKGKLFYETGILWYEGTFRIEKHGNLGYPIFKGSASFYTGTEYDMLGNVVIVYKDRH